MRWVKSTGEATLYVTAFLCYASAAATRDKPMNMRTLKKKLKRKIKLSLMLKWMIQILESQQRTEWQIEINVHRAAAFYSAALPRRQFKQSLSLLKENMYIFKMKKRLKLKCHLTGIPMSHLSLIFLLTSIIVSICHKRSWINLTLRAD
jgi:hypothetical protein